jgi:uncharacterized protein (DUF736 family)
MSKIIGTFIAQGNQMLGNIRTLDLNVTVKLIPVEKKEEKSPSFRVMHDNYELGAAWEKTSEQGSIYWSVKIDDPLLPAPLTARLVSRKDSEDYLLIWSRS